MVAIRCTSLLLASAALLSSYVNAYGQIAQVVDANNFCVFLPPADSVDRGISETEWNAEAFCIGKTPLATNAGKLHSGFIQSAHYLETEKYVQVTGKISPTVERLNATDEGGQYDIKAPKGSSCAGWKFYVNLVEPSQNTYCMRCCNDDRSCNRGISEKGCAHIIPGDYSGPSSGSKTTTTKKITTTTTTKKSTTTTKKSTTTTTTVANVTTTTPVATSTTTTSDDINTTTSAVNVANVNAAVATDSANSSAAPTPNVAVTPNASAADDKTNTEDSINNVSALGQSEDDVVSAQSVNSGVEKFQPSMVAFTVLIIVGMFMQ
ncbi:hypothetical protein BD770DRAFT_448514 [Pilaira anomala]|nr:hypothetical protein BD770DRAFT_448514 [Pilaira anomala]